jgi:hypothetical protein
VLVSFDAQTRSRNVDAFHEANVLRGYILLGGVKFVLEIAKNQFAEDFCSSLSSYHAAL